MHRLLVFLMILIVLPAASADPTDRIEPQLEGNVHGISAESCGSSVVIMVALGAGQAPCEGTDCSGNLLVATILIGRYNKACDGPQSCSGNVVQVNVVYGGDSKICRGQHEACNHNTVLITIFVAAQKSEACAVGVGSETVFKPVGLGDGK